MDIYPPPPNLPPPHLFVLDCVFKILPMQRYSAQEQLNKATTNPKSMPEVVILQKLKVCMWGRGLYTYQPTGRGRRGVHIPAHGGWGGGDISAQGGGEGSMYTYQPTGGRRGRGVNISPQVGEGGEGCTHTSSSVLLSWTLESC